MLTLHRQSELLTQLLEQMAIVKANPTLTIEYGDPTKRPGWFLSAIRIRWMQTAGGWQFRICELRSGTEGSGAYFPTEREAAMYAMQRVVYYHRPLAPALQERFGRSEITNLSFFTYGADTPIQPPVIALMAKNWFSKHEDVETIDLGPVV